MRPVTALSAILVGLAMLHLAGCNAAAGDRVQDPAGGDAKPRRIVSLDYCADQYVLRFADRADILALSPDAKKPFSYMRAAAAGLPSVRPTAEDVLALRPDLVVRAYGGGPNAAAFFERAGVDVLDVGWAGDIAGMKAVARDMAEGLGAAGEGAALVKAVEARLASLPEPAHPRTVLYSTPGGVTSGPGSLVHEMIEAAGHENFERRPGWHPIPLERLVAEQPGLLAHAAFDSHVSPWSAARHPIARHLADRADTVHLEGAWTACGGWFLTDAIEALAVAGAGPDE